MPPTARHTASMHKRPPDNRTQPMGAVYPVHHISHESAGQDENSSEDSLTTLTGPAPVGPYYTGSRSRPLPSSPSNWRSEQQNASPPSLSSAPFHGDTASPPMWNSRAVLDDGSGYNIYGSPIPESFGGTVNPVFLTLNHQNPQYTTSYRNTAFAPPQTQFSSNPPQTTIRLSPGSPERPQNSEEPEGSVYCEPDDEWFDTEEEHEAYHRKDFRLPRPLMLQKSARLPDGRWVCRWDCCKTILSGESYGRRRELERHMDSCHCSLPWTCEICGREYTRQDTLKRHMNDAHPEDEESSSASTSSHNEDISISHVSASASRGRFHHFGAR